MTTKLTLTMEAGVIERMKDYAAATHSSISKITENYFVMLTDRPQATAPSVAISPYVRQLNVKAYGVALPDGDIDYKAEIAGYLEEKYK
ncbi:MAG: DUF6364 family protein [Prevotellaceae bacterium]|jgi:hypothetical protein|nr:DUF6364 family protein [Prevotellaceae bacterium]